jgi:glutaredoxin
MTTVFAAIADAAERREAATARATARTRVFMREHSTPAEAPGEYLGAMAVRLHRCPNEWVKLSGHPCWKVQKALDESGVEYELVKGPLRSGKRDDLERISGQRKYPVIEFDDGSVYREESKDMEATIRSGRLDEKRSTSVQ